MEQEFINKAKDFIEMHIKKDFSLDDLANFVGYSSYHFTREFKDAIGLSIIEYVREQRVSAPPRTVSGYRIFSEKHLWYNHLI